MSAFDSGVTKAWCNTRAKQIKICFKWNIENFSLTYKTMGSSYKSSIFFADDYEPWKWYLELRPNGYTQNGIDYVSIYLCCCNKGDEEELNVSYKCSLFNDKGEETNVHQGNDVFKINEGIGWHKFIKKDFLLDISNGLLPLNNLQILCEVNFVLELYNASGKSMNIPIKVMDSKLGDDLIKVFENSKFCDITLVAGGQEIKAHKAILAARSNVFAAMFTHNLEEAKSNRVVIDDIDYDVLKELLHFIYTNEAPNLNTMSKDLFVAADKYNLQKLKKMCEQALCVNLSIDNAIKTSVIAECHGANQLKDYTKSFIHNHAYDVIETQIWKEVTKYPH